MNTLIDDKGCFVILDKVIFRGLLMVTRQRKIILKLKDLIIDRYNGSIEDAAVLLNCSYDYLSEVLSGRVILTKNEILTIEEILQN